MKRYLILILLLLAELSCYSQIRSKVDERFELASIMFALAGAPEYNDCQIPSYKQDIHTKLSKYELTAPINYVRELAQHHAIGYDAVMTAADMMNIQNGRVTVRSGYDICKISEIDKRWNKELFAQFIKMADKFYRLSNFHQFIEKHRNLITVAEHQANQLLDTKMMEWFNSFFGCSSQLDLQFYISLTNGPHNYSVPNGMVLGMKGDVEGGNTPISSVSMFILSHEIAHHYTNPLVDTYWLELQNSANKIYPQIKDQIAQYGYNGAHTATIEGLNNLFALMYLKETGDGWFNAEVGTLMRRGFVWMERGVAFMENFYNNRDRFPHIRDFMPQLIAFLNYTADHIDLVVKEHENSNPRIVNIFPAVGSNISGFNQIVITFSEPMLGATGFNGSGVEDMSVESLDFEDTEWSEDYRRFTIKLIPEKIKPNCIYGLQLRPDFFKSARYYNLDENCKNIIFNTLQK